MRLLFAMFAATLWTPGCAARGGHTVVSGAQAAMPPAISWSAQTGLLSCRGGKAVLAVPQDLRARVTVGDAEATILLGDGRGGLMMTVSRSPAGAGGPDVLADLPRVWTELHRQTTGQDLRHGQLSAEAHLTKRGRFASRYSQELPSPPPVAPSSPPGPTTFHPSGVDISEPRDTSWSLVYVEAGLCRIAAIDRAERDDDPRLGPLLDTLYVPPNLAP